MLEIFPQKLSGLSVIKPQVIDDHRGWFARIYCKDELTNIAPDVEWVQINHSYNKTKGTLRGLHFQHVPYAEIKMVRCIVGSVYDVVVDLRYDSPTFLQWIGIELSAENQLMLLIPEGFAHGFQTMEPSTQLIYHHSARYKPEAEGGLNYADPLLNISWPLRVTEISDKDLTRDFLPSRNTEIISSLVTI